MPIKFNITKKRDKSKIKISNDTWTWAPNYKISDDIESVTGQM